MVEEMDVQVARLAGPNPRRARRRTSPHFEPRRQVLIHGHLRKYGVEANGQESVSQIDISKRASNGRKDRVAHLQKSTNEREGSIGVS